MIFYFTATGNCLDVARQLDTELTSIAQVKGKNTFRADKIGVVCPVYAFDIPSNVKEFLQQNIFDTPYFYMVLTYGNHTGGVEERAQRFLQSIGKKANYINTLLMIDNCLPAFDIEEQLKMDKKTEEHLAAIQEDIRAQKQFIKPETEEDRAFYQGYLNAPFKLHKEQDFVSKGQTLYRINDKCIGCGICTKVCPKASMTLQDKKVVYKIDNCVFCMACINACPKHAIEFTFPEKNPNARYRNAHVTLQDIIRANCQQGN